MGLEKPDMNCSCLNTMWETDFNQTFENVKITLIFHKKKKKKKPTFKPEFPNEKFTPFRQMPFKKLNKPYYFK